MKKNLRLKAMKYMLGIFCLTAPLTVSAFEIEAEDVPIISGPVVKESTHLPSGKFVGDVANGSVLEFSLPIDKEGWYVLGIHYMMESGSRSLYVKANKQEKQKQIFDVPTCDWSGESHCTDGRIGVEIKYAYVYLRAGNAKIQLSADNWGPNLDKFTLEESLFDPGLPIPDEGAKDVFPYSFVSDKATKLYTDKETGSFANVKDCDEMTVYDAGDKNVVVEVECAFPVVLTSVVIATESANLNNWVIEYSKDKSEWTNLGFAPTEQMATDIYRFKTGYTNGETAARYFRLTASDESNVKIGEFQLFGFPYIESADGKTFPEDITKGDVIDENNANITASHPGINYSDEGGTFDERFFNLFDRKLMTKYTAQDLPNPLSLTVSYQPLEGKKVTSYAITTCIGWHDRDPKSWNLKGFNPETGEYEEIDSQKNILFPSDLSTLKFYIKEPKEYMAYQLEVTEYYGGGLVQMQKLQLFDESDGTVNIGEVRKDSFLVSGDKGFVVLRSDSSTPTAYQILNLQGQLLKQGLLQSSEEKVNLETGFYIVKLGTTITKVVVR